jgi:hypothetical protein
MHFAHGGTAAIGHRQCKRRQMPMVITS